MKDIHIAGTGIWYPEDTISNDEIVLSFNSYVDNFNTNNKDRIDRGEIEKLEYSSTEFIEKASGIKTRHVIDKKNIEVNVWERGAGLTKACGTAACATAVASFSKNLTERKVQIAFDQGSLKIEYNKDKNIFMTGPVSKINELSISI